MPLHMTPAHGSSLQGEVFGTHEFRALVFLRDFLRLMRASDSGVERERGEREKMRGRRRRQTAAAMVDEAEEMGQLRRGEGRKRAALSGEMWGSL